MPNLFDVLHKIADLIPHNSEGGRDQLHADIAEVQADLDRVQADADAADKAPADTPSTTETPAADTGTQTGVQG